MCPTLTRSADLPSPPFSSHQHSPLSAPCVSSPSLLMFQPLALWFHQHFMQN